MYIVGTFVVRSSWKRLGLHLPFFARIFCIRRERVVCGCAVDPIDPVDLLFLAPSLIGVGIRCFFALGTMINSVHDPLLMCQIWLLPDCLIDFSRLTIGVDAHVQSFYMYKVSKPLRTRQLLLRVFVWPWLSR